jgi:hypothetical protein
MSHNPFLSHWLSAANSAAGAWRGFWTAEMARQQALAMAAFQRQALEFWAGVWTQAMAAAPAGATPRPDMAGQPAVTPVPPAVTEAVPALEEEPRPASIGKRPAPLRAAVQHRTGRAKRTPAKALRGRAKPITRH